MAGIEVERLTRCYGVKVAIDDLSFRVRPGELVGFVGPNGAGKTTTARVLAGLLAPTNGTVTVAGADVTRQPTVVKQRLGYVPESPALYDSLTTNEYFRLVACLHSLDSGVARTKAHELLDVFGAGDAADRVLHELSKGMRQKVVIIAALLHAPEVLVLDEPLDGLDPTAIATSKQLFRDLCRTGRAILFSSHSLEVVEKISDRILLINRGRKAAEGTASEIVSSVDATSLEEAFGILTNQLCARDASVIVTGERVPD